LRRLALAAALLLVAALGGWWAFGPLAAVIAVSVVAFGLLFRHEQRLRQLVSWAAQPVGTPVPEMDGSWAQVSWALQRRSNQAVKQREEIAALGERFRLAAEALPEGVLILDERLAIEWMNPRAEILLGLDAGQDLGTPITHLVREQELASFLDTRPRSDTARYPLVLRPLRSAGRVLHVRAAPFSAGRILLLVEDLTQLERLETIRRDFVANVSHEMRTPLTVVQGFLETAKNGIEDKEHPVSPEEIVQYLDLALDHAHRMLRLVEDLLSLSTLETDAPPVEEMLAVETLLALLKEEAQALSSGRHRLRIENTGPANLRGSSRELHSAFSNLVSNAVRYTPEGGEVAMRWRSLPDGGGVFEVEDSGIGIEARHIPRLTERFYRVDRGRSRESGGTGLGLAIVKHVIERHQGVLSIESEPGEGSLFSAHFPARRVC